MSGGYAERLSEYPNKGICGLPENYDTKRAFTSKIDKLSQLVQQSNYTVVLTGAGISTSAGIPDFRGPSGIWTREQQVTRKRRKKKKQMLKNDERVVECCVEKATDCSTTNSASDGKNDDDYNVPLHEQSNGRKRKQKDDMDDMDDKPKFKSFGDALPTYTHRALTHLILYSPPTTNESSDESNNCKDDDNNNKTQRTYLHHIVTQNVDGLHRKTNLPRNKMSVLHGCIFTEICDTCNTEHVRKHEIQSIGLKHTGEKCSLGGTPVGTCPGKLKDTLLDWEDDLPQIDWDRAQDECSKADLVLCLGTSLRIEPAASLCTYPTTYPTATAAGAGAGASSSDGGVGGKKKRKGKQKETKLGYVIVNLQQTPYDDGAALVVRAKVDDVMKGLMEKLGYGYNWDAIEH